jgi:soluble lytic murein transglycosylase-like protein
VKPPSVKGGTVVGATAALGAVVTGSFMAGAPAITPGATAEAAEALLPAHLASTSGPLRIRSAATNAPEAEPVATTALLPVAVPGDRVAATDQRDVEALHKGETLAAEAAAQHAAAVKVANVLSGGGNLNDWISVALDQMGMPQSLSAGVKRVIMAESRGNPLAVNRTDSNALAGRPSRGLMQVIPSTFRAYVLPSLAGRPITDPVANITAGVRYMLANYGLGTLKQGGNRDRSGNYLPY